MHLESIHVDRIRPGHMIVTEYKVSEDGTHNHTAKRVKHSDFDGVHCTFTFTDDTSICRFSRKMILIEVED